VSYVFAFAGFAALILLHEAGHFAAAKAVGMRVERFSLFLGPLLVKVRRGETEYGIGPIPLGGYVKISGMNPREELPPDVVPRAYYNQKVWKRVVVILAGPFVNLVVAFLILFVLVLANGEATPTTRVADISKGSAAAGTLQVGDRILSVDGRRGGVDAFRSAIGSHTCAGTPVQGCRAATPVHVVVLRHGARDAIAVRPRYDSVADRTLLGFAFGSVQKDAGVGRAITLSGQTIGDITKATLGVFGKIFQAKERKNISSVVGGYKTTQKSFQTDTTEAFFILAVISLSLAIINLFPFLPLDGGHVFWALAEKVRGKRIPFSVLERASAVGIALVLLVFAIGLSNDINHIQHGGFKIR
jgi:regulator of sigma E protease